MFGFLVFIVLMGVLWLCIPLVIASLGIGLVFGVIALLAALLYLLLGALLPLGVLIGVGFVIGAIWKQQRITKQEADLN